MVRNLNMVASIPKLDIDVTSAMSPSVNAPGSGKTKNTKDPLNPEFRDKLQFEEAFPKSEKIYKKVEFTSPQGIERTLEIPYRRIHLEDEDPG